MLTSDPQERIPERDPEDGPVDLSASEERGGAAAPIDSIVAPVVDHVLSFEETKPFETDEFAATPPSPPTYRTTARISIQAQAPMPFPSKEEVKRLLDLPPPPPSPLISLSPPSAEERLARCFDVPVLLSPTPIPTSSPLPSPSLPPLPASLFIPSPVDRRKDIPEAELPPHKRLCLTTSTSSTLDAETRRQRAEEVGYDIRDVWVDPTEAVQEVAPTTLEGVNDRVIKLVGVLEEDTQDIYAFHQETVLLMKQEALVSREAWAHSEALTVTLVVQVSFLQGQLLVALGQIQALQARYPTHADDPEGANSCNNMPPRRTLATARAAAAAAPMIAAAIE
ncbi:hypothetical protein Tco_1027057 [Tanacetum coccineum]